MMSSTKRGQSWKRADTSAKDWKFIGVIRRLYEWDWLLLNVYIASRFLLSCLFFAPKIGGYEE